MWVYKELVSCPMPLLIGSFKYTEIIGYVTLLSMNHRLNILLDRGDKIRVVSNIGQREWIDNLAKICLATYTGRINELSTVERVLAHSMFYGGLFIGGVIGDNIYVVSPDYVRRDIFKFILRKEHSISYDRVSEAKLEDWVILQLALREGLVDLLMKICRESFRSIDDTCILNTSHGELYISAHRDLPDGVRVVPDNNPLRHVVSV